MVSEQSAVRDVLRFRVIRDEDESGVSGTGCVAVGSLFPSGTCVIEWRNNANSELDTASNGLAVYPGEDGFDDMVAVHGHNGKTRFEFVDEEFESE